MNKMYTVDHKLLTEIPEIRVGEKIYPVNNRTKTVKKIHDATGEVTRDNPYPGMEKVLALALGAEAAKEIEEMDMPFPAYQKMFELVMTAVTGEEPNSEQPDVKAN